MPERIRVDPRGKEFRDVLAAELGGGGNAWSYFGPYFDAWERLHRLYNEDDERDRIDLVDDYCEDMAALVTTLAGFWGDAGTTDAAGDGR